MKCEMCGEEEGGIEHWVMRCSDNKEARKEVLKTYGKKLKEKNKGRSEMEEEKLSGGGEMFEDEEVFGRDVDGIRRSVEGRPRMSVGGKKPKPKQEVGRVVGSHTSSIGLSYFLLIFTMK
eukprot:Lithocolla_globosa_v1_NODE_10853_length_560_cov_1.641584.p1 type:complete len:120 gc:universal NODE_10853_length_560_cov_1.641584:414-55(-)